MQASAYTIAFEALAFIYSNAKVHRKYFVLPFFILLFSAIIAQIPAIGSVIGVLGESLGEALLTVSVIRFYFLRNADHVADQVNRPFKRVFFYSFLVSIVCEVVYKDYVSGYDSEFALAGLQLIIGLSVLYVMLMCSFTLPMLALDFDGSVLDIFKKSYHIMRGKLWRLIFIIFFTNLVFIGYSVISFLFLTGIKQQTENYTFVIVGALISIFMSVAIYTLSYIWSMVSLAKLFEQTYFLKRDLDQNEVSA